MAAMIHSPVLLRAQPQEDEDIALAHFIQTQGAWQKHHPSQQQQQQQQQQQPLPYAYVASKQPSRATPQPHRSRPRMSNNPHVQKSTSTPVSPAHRTNRKPQQAHPHAHPHSRPDRRPKSMMPESRPPFAAPRPSSSSSVTTASDSGRRSSITSVSSSVSQTVSVTSTASVSSKVSLSRRLRKVFSMSNLRSSRDLGALSVASSSTVSVNTIDSSSMQSIPEEGGSGQTKSPGFRRRSLASLSSLFLRNNASQTSIAEEKSTTAASIPSPAPSASTPSRRPQGGSHVSKNERKPPSLRVDTDQAASAARKSILKARASGSGPDSPNSAISSRSPIYRTPPTHRLAQSEGLPSPTPSSSSGSNQPRVPSVTQHDDDLPAPPAIGYHYGLPLHGSPKLKPATSSTSSLTDLKRKLQFSSTIQVHETFASADYDRRCDPNATCQRLSPMIAMKIKQELNEYKLTDMEVHVESRQYTHFFL